MRMLERHLFLGLCLIALSTVSLVSCGNTESDSSGSGGSDFNPLPTDLAPIIEFARTESTGSENDDDAVELRITRVSGLSGDVTVRLTVLAESADPNTDMNLPQGDSFIVILEDGRGGPRVNVGTVVDDLVVEGSEKLIFELSEPTGGAILNVDTRHEFTIADNDAPGFGALQFREADANFEEDGGRHELCVTRSGGGTTGTVAATVAVVGGDADPGVDFDFVPATGRVQLGGGDTRGCIGVVPVDDASLEGTETIELQLTALEGGAVTGTQDTATLSIFDDDVPGEVHFVSTEIEVVEGTFDETVEIEVERREGSSGAVTVDVSLLAGGTATNFVDFQFLSDPETLEWDDGETGTKSFNIPIVSDDGFENVEMFFLDLDNETGGVAVDPGEFLTVSIRDNDGQNQGNVQFTQQDYMADEADDTFTINVERVNGRAGVVETDYEVRASTAVEGRDFVADTGTLTWGNLDASNKTIEIELLDDDVIDGDVEVFIELTELTPGFNYGFPSFARLTLIDDEVGAAPGWAVRDSGTSNTLFAVAFFSPLRALVFGDNGEIRHTTDRGVSWSEQDSGTSETLRAAHSFSGNNFTVVGDGGTILNTDDEGDNWTEASDSGTTEDLRGIHSPFQGSPFRAYAVGDNGTIVVSDASLQTWTPQVSNTIETLYGVAFASTGNDDNGWVVGSNGTILATTDGGTTWTPQDSGTVEDLLAIRRITDTTLVVTGAGGVILRTENGGDDWTGQDSGVPANLLAVDVIPGSSTAWAAGGFGAIVTTDNASTWSSQSSPTVMPLFGIRMANQEGYAVGAGGQVLYTESGGNPP